MKGIATVAKTSKPMTTRLVVFELELDARFVNDFDSIRVVPYFICPKCTWRGTRLLKTEGFSYRPAACEKCGFGFLFELLDDYFPSPRCGVFVCDQQGRISAAKGVMELTGFAETEIMGHELGEALNIMLPEGGTRRTSAPRITRMGSRVLDKQLVIEHADGHKIEM